MTLLNLGRHFAIAQRDWPSLCERIGEILSGQAALLPGDSELEGLARQYGAQLLLRHGHVVKSLRSVPSLKEETLYVEVDADSLEILEPRSVGVEHVALSVMREIGFIEELERLGFKRAQSAAAIGNVIARMAQPASELAVGSVNSDHIFSGNSDHLGDPAEARGRTPASDPTGGGKDDRDAQATRDSGAAPGRPQSRGGGQARRRFAKQRAARRG